MKENKKLKTLLKISFLLVSALIFLALTKIKIWPILGLKSRFSLSVFFGPTFASVFGIWLGTLTIVFTHLIGLSLGIYKMAALKDVFIFFPIIFAGIYFSRTFKSDKKQVIIPLACIFFFIIHPIGRTVWFYSGFWLVPIIVSLFKDNLDRILKIPLFRVYGYSLGAAFTDHAVGSVIYLYIFSIPAHFWIAAIPLTLIERLTIAGGIEFSYFFEKEAIAVLDKLPIFLRAKELIFE